MQLERITNRTAFSVNILTGTNFFKCLFRTIQFFVEEILSIKNLKTWSLKVRNIKGDIDTFYSLFPVDSKNYIL